MMIPICTRPKVTRPYAPQVLRPATKGAPTAQPQAFFRVRALICQCGLPRGCGNQQFWKVRRSDGRAKKLLGCEARHTPGLPTAP
jgi:hypothetical protein